VKGVVVAAIDGFGPLCDIVVAETMVAETDDGRLGDDSLMVATVMGIDEFPEGVTTFVSIAV
jgi:zinc transporter ZupT